MTDSLSACRINIKFESTITKKTPYGVLKVVGRGGFLGFALRSVLSFVALRFTHFVPRIPD